MLLLVLWNCVYIPLQMAAAGATSGFQVAARAQRGAHDGAGLRALTAVDYLIDVAFLVDIGVN